LAEVGETIITGRPVRRMCSTARATMSSEAYVLVVWVPGLPVRSSSVIRCPRYSPTGCHRAVATEKKARTASSTSGSAKPTGAGAVSAAQCATTSGSRS
jgi:hypothetical protein